MSQPARPVGDASSPPPATPAGDDARALPRSGEFDRVLDKRQARPEAGRTAREGTGPTERDSRGLDPVAGRQPQRRDERGGEGGEGHGQGGDGRQEPMEWRALPGDIALPMGLPARPELAAGSGVRAAELLALVEQIAGRIVQEAALRLGPEGTAEARFTLDLASHGQAGLELVRGADGTLAVRFEVQTAELARVLENGLPDLLARLEARGLDVREMVVRDPDGVRARLEPGVGASDSEESRRQEEQQRQRQRHPAPAAEEAGDDDW